MTNAMARGEWKFSVGINAFLNTASAFLLKFEGRIGARETKYPKAQSALPELSSKFTALFCAVKLCLMST
ncbi:hypothetical protein D3C80_1246890 [compost metagenome]